jgi:hypothetical protein
MPSSPRDASEYYRVAEVALSALGTDERALEVNAIAAAILATVPARTVRKARRRLERTQARRAGNGSLPPSLSWGDES